MEEYTFTSDGGWARTSGGVPAVIDDCDDLSVFLFTNGYTQLAQSCPGRCQVGHFIVWAQEEDTSPYDRYAIVIDQVAGEAIVWCATLPALWDFLAKYASIGSSMHRLFPGEHENENKDEDDGLTCADCGSRMTVVEEEEDDPGPDQCYTSGEQWH